MVDAGNFPGKFSVAEFALEWFFTSVLSIMTGYNCQTFVRISTSFLRTFKMTVLVFFKFHTLQFQTDNILGDIDRTRWRCCLRTSTVWIRILSFDDFISIHAFFFLVFRIFNDNRVFIRVFDGDNFFWDLFRKFSKEFHFRAFHHVSNTWSFFNHFFFILM